MALPVATMMSCGGGGHALATAWTLTVLFFGWYTLLGAVTVFAAIALLRGRDVHQAISMVGLYVCTIVTGGRVWELCFTINASAFLHHHPGLFWFDWDSFRHTRSIGLWIALPFLALAGHCFITACGDLISSWTTLRNRIAVVLCGITLCAGLLCPLLIHRLWREWVTDTLPMMAQTCADARNLTDQQTMQLAKAYPDDWRALLLRTRYLADVGRVKEAQDAMASVRRILPSDKPDLRERVERAMKDSL